MKKPIEPIKPTEPKPSYNAREFLCFVPLERYRKYTLKQMCALLTKAASNKAGSAVEFDFEFASESEYYGLEAALYTYKNNVNSTYDLDIIQYKKDVVSYEQKYAEYLLKLEQYNKKLSQEKDKAAEQRLADKRKLFEKLKKELEEDS